MMNFTATIKINEKEYKIEEKNGEALLEKISELLEEK